jgi:drug/metabolite transporter (DMT)-like permease
LAICARSPRIGQVSAPRRRHLPWLALFVVYIVWGSTYLAIRVVVRELPPFAAAGLRFLVAGLAMSAIAYAIERPRTWPTRTQLRDYTVIGLLLLAGANGLLMWAERSVPSGIAALIVATVPLWLTLLDGLRSGGRRWTPRVWLGTLIGLAGVGFLVRPRPEAESLGWGGVIALQAGALLWSVGSLYAQATRHRLPVLQAAAIEMLAGAFGLLVQSLIVGEDLSRFAAAGSHAWVGLAYLAVFGSLIGFTAFAYALHELPATTVGTYAYVNPIVAVALGALILGEAVSPGMVAAAALILIGVLLTTLRGSPASGGRDSRQS